MSDWYDVRRNQTKVRGQDTWDQVRRAWEGGETAASCARRFDVGLANLWRRRAAEGWDRERPADPSPEPAIGWDEHAARRLEAFELKLKAKRSLAETLARLMLGDGPIGETPLWHVPFVYAWRAQNRGPEVAARDRERGRAHPWAEVFWDAEGRLKPLVTMDWEMLRLFRDEWREGEGLPAGAAPFWPRPETDPPIPTEAGTDGRQD